MWLPGIHMRVAMPVATLAVCAVWIPQTALPGREAVSEEERTRIEVAVQHLLQVNRRTCLAPSILSFSPRVRTTVDRAVRAVYLIGRGVPTTARGTMATNPADVPRVGARIFAGKRLCR